MKQFKCWILDVIPPTGKRKKVFSPSYREAVITINSMGCCDISASHFNHRYYIANNPENINSIDDFVVSEGRFHHGVRLFRSRDEGRKWYDLFKLNCMLVDKDVIHTFKTGVANATN